MKIRTAKQMEEDIQKTLYIRLPHTIKDTAEIKELCPGNVKVKLQRQSARHCHVVFPSLAEKMKNLKRLKSLKIDGKRVIAYPPKLKPPEEKKKKEKKIRMPKPVPEPKITKTLHISNIKPGTKPGEIKDAFPGSISVVMVKTGSKTKIALVKCGSVQLAGEYLRKEREWPEIRGNKVSIKADTRKRKNKNGSSKPKGLKIYDGEESVEGENTSQLSLESSDKESEKSEEEAEEDEIAEDSSSSESPDTEEE